jgi:hypothetical protein
MMFVSARSRAGARAACSAFRTAGAAAAVLGLALLAAGCTPNKFQAGTPVVTFTSSAAGFGAYRIVVYDIYLTRNDGYVVALLNIPGDQVDLTQLDGMAELVCAPAVPTGTYTSASITFDYGSTATYNTPIISVNYNGADRTTSLGTDSNNSPYLLSAASTPAGIYGTQQTVSVTFDPQHPLVINQSQSSRIAFNFDLEASNILNVSGLDADPAASPYAYVNPIVTPSTTPVDSTPMRARGILVQAQSGSSNFVMNMHPFNDQSYTLGALTVQTTAQTYFNINGTVYTGAAGLAALASQPINTVVAAYGSLGNVANVGVTPSFNAATVVAGTTLESAQQTHITGIVGLRTDNSDGTTLLVIRGATLIPQVGFLYNCFYYPANCLPYFAQNMSVKIDGTTLVTQDGVTAGVSSQSISLGQLIDVSGQSSFDPSNGYVSLDATYAAAQAEAAAATSSSGSTVSPVRGQARLLATPIWGTLSSATPGSASLAVLQLGPYPPPAFWFLGTGINPASYVVGTGSFDLSQIPPGSLISLTGFPAAFGSAASNFNAITMPAPAQQQQLIVEWWHGTAATQQPFANITSAGASALSGTGLTFTQPNTQLSRFIIHTGPTHVRRSIPNSVDIDLLNANPQPTFPTISTASASPGTLQLTVGNLTTGHFVYSSMSDFQTEIAKLESSSAYFTKLVAFGQYDATANVFNATSIVLAQQ